ncbi:MAG: hypothetical protein KIT84_18730 [Labilithrix sp.]|nr:hypothetical protein [Labilithrix sp.]MCW5813070.1 hypothetical protein [Labilithrix sp.]
MTLPRQSPVLAVAMFSLVAVVYALLFPLYYYASDARIEGLWFIGGFLSLLLAVLVVLRTRAPMELRWGVTRAMGAARRLDRSPIERHVRRHLKERLTVAPAPPRVRVDLFARRDESVTAWLGRIDALDRGEGYRGESAPRELLFETVADAHAPIDVRLAAARVLRVRDRESPERIAGATSDEDVRVRIAAVTVDDATAAAAELEEVGSMFRARDD